MSRRRSAYGRWAWVHRWSALTLGLVIAVIGGSGAVLVLKEPVLAWELGTMLTPLENDGLIPASPVTWTRTALAEETGAIRLMVIMAPRSAPIPSDAVLAFYAETTADGRRHHLVGIDPVRGTILGRAIFEDLWFQRLLNLHRALLAGPVGAIVVALCGAVLCLSTVSGGVVWISGQRRGGRPWRQVLAPSLRGRARTMVRSLHAAGGLYLALPLLVLSVSGIFLAQPKLLSPFVSPAERPAATSVPPADDCRPIPNMAQAVARALDEHRQAGFVSVGGSPGPQAPFSVTLTDGTVLVDAMCGAVIQAPAAGGPHQVARATFGSLHADLTWGIPGQIIVFLTGLALPILFGSGVWLWQRQHRRRRDQRARP